MPKGEDGVCVVERRLALLAGRFRAEILKALEQGEVHFNALKRLTGASANSLTRQVRALEEEGLVTSRRETRWGRNQYALTEAGRRTLAILDAVAKLPGP
ncbi:helix-turn-helix transcriptional regulator [Pyxidicoccus fallax]|uniref:Helix-turn-helix transcriptional regulator n=1 Tax=Pyxidicoccus fallax TaxID=394095 RepID=A0A848LIT0_9BACT|nr:helix-turn-helix domain-containing protein [Pyxidicoccus fallax]NMO17596.1 helix-turn-helix transcriptional regulator [Pyxidicoccus fallax]NPC86685.1 helix-turn-helix transcriptional regulator [Pyxidicoccus fallax]